MKISCHYYFHRYVFGSSPPLALSKRLTSNSLSYSQGLPVVFFRKTTVREYCHGDEIMELNLPEWLFGWHQLLFMFYIFVSVIPTVAFIASNNEEVISRQPQLIFHLLGKVGLDIALVMGISGTAIAMMAHLLSDAGNTDSYLQSTYIVAFR